MYKAIQKINLLDSKSEVCKTKRRIPTFGGNANQEEVMITINNYLKHLIIPHLINYSKFPASCYSCNNHKANDLT